MTEVTDEMVDAAATVLIRQMFAPHELPVDDELWRKYAGASRLALVAALSARPHQTISRPWHTTVAGSATGEISFEDSNVPLPNKRSPDR